LCPAAASFGLSSPGHYVNYLKQVSPSMLELLPETLFRLYAVSARFPRDLAGQVPWTELQKGVYECRRGTDVIRVLVAGELPKSQNNALLHLFSAAPEQASYGAAHYKLRTAESSTLLNRLFALYRKEGLEMPYTMEDFRRDYVKEHLKDLTLEERLKDVSLKEHLAAVPEEKRLESVEELLKGLSQEQVAALLKRLKADDSAATS
jgi:hypothetical protein